MNELAVGVAVGLAYLVASAAVFVFGSSYYTLFPTNRSWVYKMVLVGGFAVSAWLTMRSALDASFGRLAVAFLAAATASLVGAAAETWLPRPLRLRDDSFRGIALRKALEAVFVVGAIGLLLAAAGVSLDAVYLRSGRLVLGLGIGLGGFALFAVLAVQQARSLRLDKATLRRQLPWILVFVFANAFMEEIWFRGLFFRPLADRLGAIAAIGLTAVVFTASHVGASYLSKDERVRFLVILLPLALAWGACLHFTGSVIASTLFHAGADLMIVVGLVAQLHGPRPDAPEAGVSLSTT